MQTNTLSSCHFDLNAWLRGGLYHAWTGTTAWLWLVQLRGGRPVLPCRLDAAWVLRYGYYALPCADELPKPAVPRYSGYLRATRATGTVALPDGREVGNLPDEMWQYELGGKPAIEHLLGGWRARVKQPKYPALRVQFPAPSGFTATELDELAGQLARLATVCVEHMRLVNRLAAVSPLHPANRPVGWKPGQRPNPGPVPLAPRPTRPVFQQLTFF